MNIAAGWYGKLPALGDFAGRRLPPSFVEAWDAWLAAGLGEWRAAAGEDAWLDAYLSGPIHRFVAGPGVLAVDLAWAGVLMPSVDRVGRYFPFTIAAPLQPRAAAEHATALTHWLDRAGSIAADALREDWGAEVVDTALVALAEAVASGLFDAGGDADDTQPPDAELARLVGASATAAGHVLWWQVLDDGGIELQRSQGLPRGAAFGRLLSGEPLTTDLN